MSPATSAVPVPAALAVPAAVVAADGTSTRRSVTYANVPGFRPLQLDLHLPAASGQPVPVVVFVHGGGWWSGSRETVGPGFADWSPSPFQRLATAGVAVATVDYRLSGEATWPAPLEDVAVAIGWLRANGEELGLDASRMALWGESAGGHLAALAALLGPDRLRGAGPVSAVVDWYGPSDLLSLGSQQGPDAPVSADSPDSREAMLLGAPVASVPDRATDASPLRHVTAGAPPFLLLHGRADRFVPVRQSELLARALLDSGVSARLELLDGADHLWMGSETAPGTAFDLTLTFLLEHLT